MSERIDREAPSMEVDLVSALCGITSERIHSNSIEGLKCLHEIQTVW